MSRLLPDALVDYLQSLKTYKLRRDDLDALQLRKLRRVLNGAYAHLPLYRSRFRSAGFSPEDVRTVADLRRLPTLAKPDIVANYPAGISRRDMRAFVTRHTTGTSGGETVSVDWSEEQVDVRNALIFRRLSKIGFRPWTTLVTMWHPERYWRKAVRADGRSQPETVAQQLPYITAISLPFFKMFRADTGDPEREARALQALKPDFITGRPSLMRRVGATVAELGLKVTPSAVLADQETITHPVLEDLRIMYGSRVLRTYGNAECGSLGSECLAESGVHLFEDYMVFEILRGDEPVGPGEQGELVVTALHNEIMPLIRYRTGDIVKAADDGACECGSSFVKVERFLGRLNDFVADSEGNDVAGLELADRIESRFGIREYQVVQEGRQRVTLKMTRGDIEDRELLAGLEAFLEGCVGPHQDFTVQEMTEDEMWQKRRPVVSSSG